MKINTRKFLRLNIQLFHIFTGKKGKNRTHGKIKKIKTKKSDKLKRNQPRVQGKEGIVRYDSILIIEGLCGSMANLGIYFVNLSIFFEVGFINLSNFR